MTGPPGPVILGSMRWFILRVQGKKVPYVLEALGDQAWRPVERRWTKPANKHKPVQVEVPLIPGWVFCQEPVYGQWPQLEGVYGPVKMGRMGVLWIEDEALETLRETERRIRGVQEGAAQEPQPVLYRPPVGSTVRIEGLLSGVSGRLSRYLGFSHAQVTVGMVTVTVHCCLLREHGV